MSNPRDVALLLDVATAAERIIAFTQGMDRVAFREDPRTHLAVQHQIIVIGEAAKRLSRALRDDVRQIP